MNIIKITDAEDSRLVLYADHREISLMHYYEPEPGLFITESTNVTKRAIDAGYEILSILAEERFLESEIIPLIKDHPDIPVYLTDLDMIKEITGYPMARGILATFRRKVLPSIEEICRDARRIAVLEDVENPTNVGAIIRSAAALGMDAVILTPGSSDPFYRRASRVSMGTCFQIPWTFMPETDPDKRLGLFQKMGFKTAAMALKDNSYNIDAPELHHEKKLALILGNESVGLNDETIRGADYTVCIPMHYNVDSLNVSTAAAVAFWELHK